MRAAMAAAPVGDDQYGEDPTTNRLQERVAALLGKEAALWLPTGTMANQVALRVLTRPGDEVVVGRETHAVWHETGRLRRPTPACRFTEIGQRRRLHAPTSSAALKPRDLTIFPPTTLVEIENTHNRGGGVVFAAGRGRAHLRARRASAASRPSSTARDCGMRPSPPAWRWTPSWRAPFDLVAVALSQGARAHRADRCWPGRRR